MISEDLSNPMVATVVVEEVFRSARHKYNLREATRIISTNDAIDVHIPLITQRIEGHRNIGELEETPLSAQRYDFIHERLHKNVAHISLSKEMQISAKQDVMKWNAEDCGRDIARMENMDIADVINTITQIAGNDWTDPAVDPFVDLMLASRTVRDEGFNPNQLWLASDSYSALLTNPNIVNRFERGATVADDLGSIAGFKIYKDNELTDGTATFIDTSEPSIMLFDGPEWIYDYNEPKAFFDGYIIADFLHVELVQPDSAITLTGIA